MNLPMSTADFAATVAQQVKLALDMATGKVEVVAEEVELLNASAPIPLLMTDEDGEEIRLREQIVAYLNN